MSELARGVVVGRYTLVEALGEGSFGEVWSATAPGETVAIKFLKSSNPDMVRRFGVEVTALSRLSHPHCVELVGSGHHGAVPYLVTEFVNGLDVLQWSQGRPLGEKLRVANQIALALGHAHQRGILHRDLKPANVLVTNDRGTSAKVLDFGIAKLIGVEYPDITKTGEVFGTPGFMSPEQLLARPLGAPTDVYALGVLLFEMLDGRPPFTGDSALAISMEHLTADRPKARAPAPISELISAMMALEPSERPTLQVVQRKLSRRGVSYDSADEEPRNTTRLVGALVATALACVVGVFVMLNRRTEPDVPPVRPVINEVRNLLKSEVPVVVTIPDVGSVDAPPDVDWGTSGCGFRPVHEYGKLAGGQVRLPENYSMTRRAPLMVLLMDVGQRPSQMLQDRRLLKFLDEEGIVAFAPEESRVSTWVDAKSHERVVEQMQWLETQICLDLTEVYIIGQGNGGLGADNIACLIDGTAAVVGTSHRYFNKRTPCDGPLVPRLLVSPLNDPESPVNGGRDCLGLDEKWPLERQERHQRKANQCRGDGTETFSGPGGTCRTYDCAEPLVLCRVNGGRFWPSMNLNMLMLKCGNPAGAFDYGGNISAFLRDVRKRRSARELRKDPPD